jgi:hypothetical protein
MTEVIVKIMLELLSVLALASKQIKQGRFSKCAIAFILAATQSTALEKFTKKLLGESEIETVLQRLDRLTQSEARITVAQTLGVVHGLVANVKTVIGGASYLHNRLQISDYSFDQMVRRQQIVFDEIWVGFSHDTDITMLTWGHSRSSQYVKRNEQDETFVVIPSSRLRD